MSKQEAKRRVVIELTSVPFRGDKGFVVLKGKVIEAENQAGIGKSLTVKGICHEVTIGAHYELEGVAKYEERYSEWQLHFRTYKINQTATATGLQNYLAKECDHIGDGRADQIVKLYGEQALEVLRTDPIRVARDVVGLNIISAQEIQTWAVQESEIAVVKKGLYESGLTPGLIRKLIESYGGRVETVLREECFSLTEIKGIGFLTADRLALKFGMPATNAVRIKEGVKYALQETMEDQGHTCILHHVLINEACKLLSLDKRHVIPVIKQMLVDKDICTEEADPKEFSRYPDLFSKD